MARGNDVYVVRVIPEYYLSKRNLDRWTNELTQIHLFYSFDEADKARGSARVFSGMTPEVVKLR